MAELFNPCNVPRDENGITPIYTSYCDGELVITEVSIVENDWTGVTLTLDHETNEVSIVPFNDGSCGTDIDALIDTLQTMKKGK